MYLSVETSPFIRISAIPSWIISRPSPRRRHRSSGRSPKTFRVDLVRHAKPLDLVAVADEDRFDDSHIHRRANGLQRVRILRIGYRQFLRGCPWTV